MTETRLAQEHKMQREAIAQEQQKQPEHNCKIWEDDRKMRMENVAVRIWE